MRPGWPDGLQFNCNVPLGMTQETGEEDKTVLNAVGQNPAQTQNRFHTGRDVVVHLSVSDRKSDLDSCSGKAKGTAAISQ